MLPSCKSGTVSQCGGGMAASYPLSQSDVEICFDKAFLSEEGDTAGIRQKDPIDYE